MREKLTYSNVMSTLAVFGILAGGTAIAADKISSKDIKRNAIKPKHIKAGAVGIEELADAAVTGGKLASIRIYPAEVPLPDDGTPRSANAGCPAGQRIIAGGADISPDSPTDAGSDTPLLESRPTTSTDGTSFGTALNAWHATAVNVAGGTAARTLRAWAVCLE